MKEYISKDYIDSILTPLLCDSRGAEHYAYDFVKQQIDHVPDSEKTYVKHGHWKLNATGSATCSHCHRTTKNAWDHESCLRYCPDCGTKMDGEPTCWNN